MKYAANTKKLRDQDEKQPKKEINNSGKRSSGSAAGAWVD